MLTLNIEAREFLNAATNEFIYVKPCTLQLEHSLISLSKWESKWKKPFLALKAPTVEEMQDYIRCMTINSNGIEDIVYETLMPGDLDKIREYITDSHTATTIIDRQSKRAGSPETPTSELIYYWMIANDIPFQCEKWHLNRLLTLIRICNIKNLPMKKMSKENIFAQNASLNAKRRAMLHSRG